MLVLRGKEQGNSCSCDFPPAPLLCVLGLLNPLDSPHHMRMDEDSEYREGIVLDRPAKPGKGSLVNCGMRKVCLLPTDAKTTSLSLWQI